MTAEPHVATQAHPEAGVPLGVRTAASWSWRLLVIGVVIYLLARGFVIFQLILVPVLIALLLVALLRPLHQGLLARPGRVGLPSGPAALVTILIGIGVLATMITVISQQISSGFPDLVDNASNGLGEMQKWLADSPLHITGDQIDGYVAQAQKALQDSQGTLVSGALTVTSTALDVFTGLFLVLFSTFFFLSSGDRIWEWVTNIFPAAARERAHGAGLRAWATLTAFIRATVIVALVDGVGVGIVAAVLGVPLAIPLGVLVFLGAFVPIVGAVVSGMVAVLVALVAVGPVKALIMLLGVIAVQQIEAHVLQPFLLGRAVAVHPLAVIVAIAAGVLLAGIVGALFAVPFVAVVNVVCSYLYGQDKHAPPKPPEREVGPLADAKRGDDAHAEAIAEDDQRDDATPAPGPA
jgi:predicted PurR-regulated permease PerM